LSGRLPWDLFQFALRLCVRPQNQAGNQGNQTKIKPPQTKKIYFTSPFIQVEKIIGKLFFIEHRHKKSQDVF
jgi:hypothetical protein